MKPVMKWAGGKGFLVDTVKDMQPKGYKRYYEPFAGGAAVLLGLRPAAATLNDIICVKQADKRFEYTDARTDTLFLHGQRSGGVPDSSDGSSSQPDHRG